MVFTQVWATAMHGLLRAGFDCVSLLLPSCSFLGEKAYPVEAEIKVLVAEPAASGYGRNDMAVCPSPSLYTAGVVRLWLWLSPPATLA